MMLDLIFAAALVMVAMPSDLRRHELVGIPLGFASVFPVFLLVFILSWPLMVRLYVPCPLCSDRIQPEQEGIVLRDGMCPSCKQNMFEAESR